MEARSCIRPARRRLLNNCDPGLDTSEMAVLLMKS
jgi:hypothetical protein